MVSLVQHSFTQVSVFSPVCLSPDIYSVPSSFFHHFYGYLIVDWSKYFFRDLCWQQDLGHGIPVFPRELGEGISWKIPTWNVCCKVGCLRRNSAVLFHSCLSVDKQSMPDIQSTWKTLFAKGCSPVSSNPHKPLKLSKAAQLNLSVHVVLSPVSASEQEQQNFLPLEICKECL